jgi:hypothetical protein
MHYGRDGKPISESAWLIGLRDGRVAHTVTHEGAVSTVWLGLKRGTDDRDRPLIFETRTTYSDGSADQRRYATEEEALAGHAEEVAKLQAGGRG